MAGRCGWAGVSGPPWHHGASLFSGGVWRGGGSWGPTSSWKDVVGTWHPCRAGCGLGRGSWSLLAPGQAVLFLTAPMSHLPGLSPGRQGRPGLWEAPGRSSSLTQWQDPLITHPGFPPGRAQGSAQAPLLGTVAWILGGGRMGWGEGGEDQSWLGGSCQAPSVLRRGGRGGTTWHLNWAMRRQEEG